MSEHRLSPVPVLTRSHSGLPGGEKAHALDEAIPEESLMKDTTDTPQKPAAGRFAWLQFDMTKTEWDILLASTCLKLLLFPAYRSTDFEVHRNWLAITHTLPISKWYYDTTSEWTLDYPPFFAYFEKLLSIPAYWLDPKIVDLNNLNYGAWSVIAYQRTTVILTELVLGAADRKLASGFLFAVLLNFKHIYLYLAPAYFVYLLRSYCLSPTFALLPGRFLSLANAVILVFLASLGPFLLMGQLPQLLSRLFPFTRGLNHAYWAPNVWALVTALDRILLRVAFQTVYMGKLWTNTSYKSFVTALTLCGFTSYMFGWHVHEKAILLVLVPLSLLATEDNAYFRTFTIASIAGIYSLFPLLFTPAETLIKVIYSTLWALFVLKPIHRQVYQFPRGVLAVIVDVMERLYLAGFPLLHLLVTFFPLVARRRSQALSNPAAGDVEGGASAMEFLPLMMTSVYCAVGLVWAFIRLSVIYIGWKD
ncbi:hypothetical protein BN946_scf184652.g33 [Trametes cinnabarina]|uniref:Alpha-1,3-glucosyltransferase n=1 Tax=Pycnoporus cinnabarinus TaxID=5643 RepID=A0A060S3E0_PYCCI|nr:hypothetical protein BN946_scf184652.g33 [Trametes cinnabarina]